MLLHVVARATLDMDATLIETQKREALYRYKHFKAYQPLNTWWAEQGLIVHSEFRDGNVPAGHEQLRILEEAARLLPAGVTKLYLRSDTAGYQQDLVKYCAEGKNERFGVIEFAVGADVTGGFKQAAAELPESAWRPLDRIVDGERCATDQQWAEVGYVPNWAGMSKTAPDYRFLAPRAVARARSRRCGAVALSDDELRDAGPLQAVRPRHQPHAGGRRTDPLAARALRQERGSACGDEGRSRRRAAAERAVRGQRGVVGDHGPRPQISTR